MQEPQPRPNVEHDGSLVSVNLVTHDSSDKRVMKNRKVTTVRLLRYFKTSESILISGNNSLVQVPFLLGSINCNLRKRQTIHETRRMQPFAAHKSRVTFCHPERHVTSRLAKCKKRYARKLSGCCHDRYRPRLSPHALPSGL
jgi:hypothetical protein